MVVYLYRIFVHIYCSSHGGHLTLHFDGQTRVVYSFRCGWCAERRLSKEHSTISASRVALKEEKKNRNKQNTHSSRFFGISFRASRVLCAMTGGKKNNGYIYIYYILNGHLETSLITRHSIIFTLKVVRSG